MNKCSCCKKIKSIIYFSNENKQYKSCQECRNKAKLWRNNNKKEYHCIIKCIIKIK